MPLNLTPIPAAGKSRTPLDDIPEDVSLAVEEAYKYCADSTERLQTEDLDSKEAAETFLSQARSYAYLRPEGRVVVTGNPASGSVKGKYVVRFRVENYVAPATETDETPAQAGK